MKIAFLQKLFGTSGHEDKKTTQVHKQQQKEIDEIIAKAVDEVIVDDSISIEKNDSDRTSQRDHDKKILKMEHDVLIKEALSTSLNFLVQKEVEGNTFEVDEIAKTCMITWNGVVSINAAQQLISMGADSVEFSGYQKLILNRSNLLEFDTEARVWIKGMLKTRAKKLARLVDQMAIVEAKTAKGSIFSNLISSAIKIVMPNLQMKKFDNIDEALEWLN